MNNTIISWTEKTWNPVSGCSPVSEGCANCYAKRMAQRLRGRCGYPADEPFKVTLHPDKLKEPLRMRKPARIFVCSMGDLFHEDVPEKFICRVWDVMRYARNHTFLVLTKRPGKMLRWFQSVQPCSEHGLGGYMVYGGTPKSYGGKGVIVGEAKHWPLPNVWLGVTCESQERADERIPILLQTPAAVRLVSVEPMLGSTDLRHLHYRRITEIDALAGTHGLIRPHGGKCAKLDWVICGGETGPGARPIHPDWARSMRDQCQAAGVPFHFKSWGAYREACASDDPIWNGQSPNLKHEHGTHFIKLNPRETGRLLDGREWDEYPEVTG